MQSENITSNYLECNKMYLSIICVQEFWYFVPGIDIQPEQSKNDNPDAKKAVKGCETLRAIYCRLARNQGLVVKVSHSRSPGSISVGC